MGSYSSLEIVNVWHEQQVESRKEELGAGATIEGKFWSRRLKSKVVRPEN
jgi:hypothetical protein